MEARTSLSRVVEVEWRTGPVRLTSPRFPLDPQPERHGLLLESAEAGVPPAERVLLGGPAVELDDRLGRHLVQSWSEGRLGPVSPHEPSAREYVARRDPEGALVWRVGLAEEVVGLDEHGGTLAVAGAEGTLWTLEATSGTVTGSGPLLSLPCCPSAMRFASDGSLWVGLGDGRLLHLRPSPRPED